MTAHGITIVMCTFCRLLHEFHNLRGDVTETGIKLQMRPPRFVEALRGMGWQLYVPYFAQIVCAMTFRTRKFANPFLSELPQNVVVAFEICPARIRSDS